MADAKEQDSNDKPLVYLDKLCAVVAAAGAGCLLCTYLEVSVTLAWILTVIALLVKLVLHAL